MRNWNNIVSVLTIAVVLHCCIACAYSLKADSNKTTNNLNNYTNGERIIFGNSIHSRVKRQASIPIDATREELLHDAVSWLSLRSGGKLLSASELQPFYDVITDKYSNSQFYRTFVVAFEFGVLPKLTLKENDKCDHSFMKGYRDPHNNSFTYYYQRLYCNYRQGLICNPLTSTCECPQGGKMVSLQTSPPTERCVLEKGIECTLADLTHDKNGDHSALTKALYHLIFNLEKPISCTAGTVCRVGLNEGAIFRCHDASNNQWWNGKTLNNTDECTIDTYVTPGMCGTIDDLIGLENLVCYDYGPRAKPEFKGVKVDARTGFCARKYGATLPIKTEHENIAIFGGMGSFPFVPSAHPLLLTFVNPRTVPFRGDKFRTYQEKLKDICENNLYHHQENDDPIDKACSVAKNTKILEMWKFYQGLENDPPAGQDFVATEVELEAKLAELQNIFGGNGKEGVCKMYIDMFPTAPSMFFQSATVLPSLACIPTGTGDNGTCKWSTSRLTRSYAYKLKSHLDYNSNIDKQNVQEEQHADLGILSQHPDPPKVMCSGNSVEVPGPYLVSDEHMHVDVIYRNLCPYESMCYEDLYDGHGIYDKGTCDFRSAYKPVYICHNVNPSVPLEICEKKHIENRTHNHDIGKYLKLKRGSQCNHRVESHVRNSLGYKDYVHPYAFLSMMELVNLKNLRGLCDATKLLECKWGNQCECVDGTAPRVSNDGQTKSDYCYLTSGPCDTIMTTLIPMTKEEKKAVWIHYAYTDAKYDCKDGNTCALLDETSQECAGTVQTTTTTTTTETIGKKTTTTKGKHRRTTTYKSEGIGRPELYPGDGGIRDTNKILLLIVMLILHLSF